MVRGSTTHYDTVAEQSARALMDLSVQSDTIIINGILTCEDEDQARERVTPVFAISGLNYITELIGSGLLELQLGPRFAEDP